MSELREAYFKVSLTAADIEEKGDEKNRFIAEATHQALMNEGHSVTLNDWLGIEITDGLQVKEFGLITTDNQIYSPPTFRT